MANVEVSCFLFLDLLGESHFILAQRCVVCRCKVINSFQVNLTFENIDYVQLHNCPWTKLYPAYEQEKTTLVSDIFSVLAHSCEGVKCHQAGEYCITDQYNRPLCIEDRFSKVCEVMPETPVCSTNGVTYKNRFCITAENVLTGSDHLLSHNGPCNSGKFLHSFLKKLKYWNVAITTVW